MSEGLDRPDFYKSVEGGEVEPLLDEKEIAEALEIINDDPVLADDQLTIDVVTNGGIFVGNDGQTRSITNLQEFLDFRREELKIQNEIADRNPNAIAAAQIEDSYRKGSSSVH